MTALALVIATTMMWYLLGMALISRPLWSRYPAWLDAWATCPACSGTWYGALVYGVILQPGELLGLAGWRAWVAAGACGMVLTPLLAALLVRALSVAGVWTRADPPEEPAPPSHVKGFGLRCDHEGCTARVEHPAIDGLLAEAHRRGWRHSHPPGEPGRDVCPKHTDPPKAP